MPPALEGQNMTFITLAARAQLISRSENRSFGRWSMAPYRCSRLKPCRWTVQVSNYDGENKDFGSAALTHGRRDFLPFCLSRFIIQTLKLNSDIAPMKRPARRSGSPRCTDGECVQENRKCGREGPRGDRSDRDGEPSAKRNHRS